MTIPFSFSSNPGICPHSYQLISLRHLGSPKNNFLLNRRYCLLGSLTLCIMHLISYKTVFYMEKTQNLIQAHVGRVKLIVNSNFDFDSFRIRVNNFALIRAIRTMRIVFCSECFLNRGIVLGKGERRSF